MKISVSEKGGKNMYKSDLTRLKACMRRAEAGEDVTLGIFGGSITQDSLATKHEYCYAYRVFQWWEKTFTKSKTALCKVGGLEVQLLIMGYPAW